VSLSKITGQPEAEALVCLRINLQIAQIFSLSVFHAQSLCVIYSDFHLKIAHRITYQ